MTKSTHTPQHRILVERLVAARKEAGLTQRGLADRLDRPQSFVAKYESGERRLDVVEFVEISKHLNVDPHSIIDSIAGT